MPVPWGHERQPDEMVVVVDAPDPLRRARLLERGLSAEQVDARLAAQPERRRWLSLADVVVDNSGTLEELESEARRVWEAVVGEPPVGGSG